MKAQSRRRPVSADAEVELQHFVLVAVRPPPGRDVLGLAECAPYVLKGTGESREAEEGC
jgi:hypothetical protein